MSYNNGVTDRCLDTSSTEPRASLNGKVATLLLRGFALRKSLFFGASRHYMHARSCNARRPIGEELLALPVAAL